MMSCIQPSRHTSSFIHVKEEKDLLIPLPLHVILVPLHLIRLPLPLYTRHVRLYIPTDYSNLKFRMAVRGKFRMSARVSECARAVRLSLSHASHASRMPLTSLACRSHVALMSFLCLSHVSLMSLLCP